jgi:hypothetical protein
MGGMLPCDLRSKGDAIPEDGSGDVVCGDEDCDHVCWLQSDCGRETPRDLDTGAIREAKPADGEKGIYPL